ncbi:MAG: GIY-YIG nuclease family protein [Beijerinckiaceae bacterium]
MSNGEQLIAGGFARAGAWRCDDASGSIRFDGEAELPRAAGVYAYVVDDEVRYVGSAQRGLRRRLRHYEIAKTLRTAHRIRQEILALLAKGHEVEVFTIVPPPMLLGVLPVDAVAGLEEGLIRSFRPVWNRRGMGLIEP